MKSSIKLSVAAFAIILLLADLSVRVLEVKEQIYSESGIASLVSFPIEKPRKSVNTRAETSTAKNREKWLNQGISEAYIDLFEEAERTIPSVPRRSGSRGVLFVTLGGVKYLERAISAAQRVQRSLTLEGDQDVKIAYFCERRVIDKLMSCNPSSASAGISTRLCSDWRNGTIFTGGVFALENYPIHPNASRFKTHQASVILWMSKTQALLHSPFERTLFLDTDAFTCPGFSRMFDLVIPFTNKLWMAPSTKTGDLAIGPDQFPYNNGHQHWPSPGDLKRLKDFKYFADRNTGTQVYNFKKGSYAMKFLNFHRLVENYLYSTTVKASKPITNDQVTFKLALYLFELFEPDFTEHTIPQHTSCRSYPGKSFAGIDGFLTGMVRQGCNSCSCSPCLVAHFASTYFLNEQ